MYQHKDVSAEVSTSDCLEEREGGPVETEYNVGSEGIVANRETHTLSRSSCYYFKKLINALLQLTSTSR